MPTRSETGGTERRLENDIRLSSPLHFLPLVIDNTDIHPGQRVPRRTGFRRRNLTLDSHRNRRNRTSQLGRPVIINHHCPRRSILVQQFYASTRKTRGGTLIECYDCGFASLAGEKDPGESPKALIARFIASGSNVLSVTVLAFDGAEGSRGREQCLDVILVDDFPKDSGVGGADGFAFVEDGCGAVEEGCVDDVRVSDDLALERSWGWAYPADVAGAEDGFGWFDVEDEFHRVRQLNGITTRLTNDS